MKYVNIIQHVLQNWWEKIVVFSPNIFAGILVFCLFWYFSKIISTKIVSAINKYFNKGEKQENAILMVRVFKFFIVLIGAFLALEIMHLGGFLTKILGSLGVAGIIAGVALKDIVSSMFSGMLVSVDKAFKVGDYVTINNISGTVEEIGFLTTKVINDEGKKVYIPNQLIFSAPFINVTASQHRKIIIDLEISNNENLEKAKEVLLNEVQRFSFVQNPENAEVIFIRQKLGIYSLQAKFWVKQGENASTVKSEAILKLKNRLDAEKISTPSPTSGN